jgi:Flp pilus assembly protein TadB
MFGLSAVATKLIGGAVIIAALIGAYFFWEGRIKKTERLENQNTELTQALKDIKDLQDKTDKLSTAQSEMLVELEKKNTAVITKQQTIRTYLDSPEAKKSDRESSEVLKETMRRMADD